MKDNINKDAEEIVAAIRLLSQGKGITGKGATIAELQEKMGMSRRSVYRRIDYIKNKLNAPLKKTSDGFGKQKRYYLPKGEADRIIAELSARTLFTKEDRSYLNLLFALPNIFDDTVLKEKFAALKAKLALLLPQQSSGFENVFDTAFSHGTSLAGKEEIFITLLNAIISNKACRIRYDASDSNNAQPLTVYPLRLVIGDGGFQVFAEKKHLNSRHSLTAADYKILALQRIKEIETGQKRTSAPVSPAKIKQLLQNALRAAPSEQAVTQHPPQQK